MAMGTNPTNAPGEAHGKTSPIRWDASTAAGLLVLAALGFLVLAHHTFTVSGSGSVSAGAR